MSQVQPPPMDGRDRSTEVPREYGDAYRRAYRRSMAEHPTELMSPARPGKRASQSSAVGAQRAKLAGLLAAWLSDPRGRMMAGLVCVAMLLAIAYCLGRLFS